MRRPNVDLKAYFMAFTLFLGLFGNLKPNVVIELALPRKYMLAFFEVQKIRLLNEICKVQHECFYVKMNVTK